jgi:hypothetical protein
MQKLIQSRCYMGLHLVESRTFSDTVYNVALTANIGKSIAIPAGAARIIMSYSGSPVYVKFTSGSSVPSAVPNADVLDGSGMEINSGGILTFPSMDHIGLISPVTCMVSITFYE